MTERDRQTDKPKVRQTDRRDSGLEKIYRLLAENPKTTKVSNKSRPGPLPVPAMR